MAFILKGSIRLKVWWNRIGLMLLPILCVLPSASGYGLSVSGAIYRGGLGFGFHDELMSVVPPCLKGREEFLGTLQTTALIYRPGTEPQIRSLLGLEAGPELTELALQDSIVPPLESYDPDTTILLRYGVGIRGFRSRLANPSLVPGIDLTTDAGLKSRCGTHFISETDRGGGLLVFARFQFVSAHMKERFSQETRLEEASVYDLAARARYAFEDFPGKVLIKLYVKQIGGDINRLTDITGAQGRIVCEKSNYQRCLSVISQLVEYLVSENGFRQQLQNAEDMADLRHTLISYQASVFPRLAGIKSDLGGEDLAARQALEERFRVEELHYAIASYRSQNWYLLPEEHARLQDVLMRITDNQAKLKTKAANCLSGLEACRRSAASLSSFVPYPQDYFGRNFRHFMDHCQNPADFPAGQGAISAIRAMSPTPSCEDIFVHFQQLDRLFLPQKYIEDVEPLISFSNLKILDVSSNKIRDARLLIHLKELKYLNLSHNLIQDQSYPLSREGQYFEVVASYGNPAILQHPPSNLSFRTVQDICSYEIQRLVSARVISQDVADSWRAAGIAPIYKAGNYRLIIELQGTCSFAADKYRPFWDKLSL